MKKSMIIFIIVMLGFIFSLVSFRYGSTNPDYSGLPKSKFCEGLVFVDLQEVTVKRGFPIQKTEDIRYDVGCENPSYYMPDFRHTLAESWQFYANWVIYSSLLVGVVILMKRIR